MLPSEIEEQINELETRVDRLRALYEQYFMGIEKMEPQVARKDVDRRIQTIRREQIRNTALRYRFHMILQRYNTFQSYWLRICREIEEGTYKRHLIRAGQKFGEVAATRALPKWHRRRFAKKAEEAAGDGIEELDMSDALESAPESFREPAPAARAAGSKKAPPLPGRAGPPAVPAPAPVEAKPVGPGTAEPTKEERMRELARRLNEKKAVAGAPAAKSQGTAPSAIATPPAPAAPAPAPAAPAPASAKRPAATPVASPPAAAAAAPATGPSARDLSEERMRQLYSELVETKRKQKESTASVTYEALAKTLRESSAKLKEKHGGRSVDFEVTVKDGKTILRPVVK